MAALEERVAKLEVQVQSSVSRTLNKHVNQVRARNLVAFQGRARNSDDSSS